MKDEFNEIKQLTPQQAFQSPNRLYNAVALTCPDSRLENPEGQHYGTSLHESVNGLLQRLAVYVRTRNFEEYIDFETELFRIANRLDSGPNPQEAAAKSFIAHMIVSGVRHALCRSSRELRLAMEEEGADFQRTLDEDADEEGGWSPEAEAAESAMLQAFEEGRLTSDDMKLEIDPEFAVINSSEIFLAAALRVGIFADGPSDRPLGLDQIPEMRI